MMMMLTYGKLPSCWQKERRKGVFGHSGEDPFYSPDLVPNSYPTPDGKEYGSTKDI